MFLLRKLEPRAGFGPATAALPRNFLSGERTFTKKVDWNEFKEWTNQRYRSTYAPTVYSYAKKYHHMLYSGLSKLETFSSDKKNGILKGLIALSKYLGVYRQFKACMVDHDIKFTQPNNVDAFLRMRTAKHDVLKWMAHAQECLGENQRLFIKFKLLSGIRTGEAVNAWNILSRKGELNNYYNVELKSLEHFKYPNVFLRGTKNVFFSFLTEDFVEEIAEAEPVSYESIRKRLERKGLNIRLKELRSYYATFMVGHGLIREEVDLLQGRVGKSMFMQHYFSPNISELRDRTLQAESRILS